MSIDKESTYYDQGGIEVNDIIKAKLTPEQYTGWLLGQVLKYANPRKLEAPDPPKRDIDKGFNYLKLLQEHLDPTETMKVAVETVPRFTDQGPLHCVRCRIALSFVPERWICKKNRTVKTGPYCPECADLEMGDL